MAERQEAAVIGHGPIQYREPPHQAGCDRYDQFVHQACLNEAADNLAAAFYHEAFYSPFTKETEQIQKIYPASAVPPAVNDFRPLLYDFVYSSRTTSGGAGQPAFVVIFFKNTGFWRKTQVAVKNNGLGVLSLDKADCQLGVIGKQRIDANDNSIGGGSNTVGQNH